jgi:hypothetical protein
MKGIFLAQLLFKQSFSLDEDFSKLKSQFQKLLSENKTSPGLISKLEYFLLREPILVQQTSNDPISLTSLTSQPQTDNSQTTDLPDSTSEPNNKTLKFNKICID